MLNAIHVHPHDIRDEGADQVIETITKLTKVKTVIAEVVALEERHPYPTGVLSHNPVRPFVISQATLEVPLPDGVFKGLPIRLIPSPEVLAGVDYLADLSNAAKGRGVNVVPWLKGLNGAFDGDVTKFCVWTLEQEAVPTWLCPAHPESLEYVFALIEGILTVHPSRAILLDRMRYPDWSGAIVKPERMLTCFCESCRKMMHEAGINETILVKGLTRILDYARHQPDELLHWSAFGNELDEIRKWLIFRCNLISKMVAQIKDRIKGFNQMHDTSTKFWLNLWPPSFAWLLGQDYQALGQQCEGAKHFPYHRLGGGADLKGLIEAMSGTVQVDIQEKLFRAMIRLLNLPYQLSFREFKRNGFPVEFVGRENAMGKKAFGGATAIYSGIQIWDTPEEEIRKACDSAKNGNADGFFFYCYGWASLQSLVTVGQYLS